MNIKRNVIFFIESRKSKDKLIVDNVPIRMRVNYGCQKIDFATGYRIDVCKWDKSRQRVKNNCTNKLQQSASDINSSLDKFSERIQTIFKEYEIKGILPTRKQLKYAFDERITKSVKRYNTSKLVDIFDEFINECSLKNNWAKSTTKRIANIKNHLIKFDKDLTFEDMTLDVLDKYVDYFRGNDFRNSTINKQISILKWFLRWGVEKNYTNNKAFERFDPKLKTVDKKVVFLTWDELTQIKECQIPETKQYLERMRDVFLFQCYTGLRYSDVYNLKRSDIKNNQIELTTIKTSDNLIIELNKYSTEILDKYSDFPFKDNKVLPVISNQRMNDYLKELGKLANINEHVRETYYKGSRRIDEVTSKHDLMCTHVGRRTFICHALSMGIPVTTVMQWTGHSDFDAMRPYIGVADKDK